MNALKKALVFAAPAALALLASLPAQALHRCTDAKGKVTYTEFDCEKGAEISGVQIHDSSGVSVNKRTNSFSYTPAPAPSRSSSSRSSTPTSSSSRRTSSRDEVARPGDAVVKTRTGEYKNTKGDTLERPPLVKWVPKDQVESERRRMNEDWQDYKKQQSELKEKWGNQPAR